MIQHFLFLADYENSSMLLFSIQKERAVDWLGIIDGN